MSEGVLGAVLAGSANIYWITVGKFLQDNYQIGIRNGLWAVKPEYRRKLMRVSKGDYVLFSSNTDGYSVCEILTQAFEDHEPVWPDDIYPYRIRISKPILTAPFQNLYTILRDKQGRPYKSPKAFAFGIRGANGVFRKLTAVEAKGIFEVVGWHYESPPPPEPDGEVPYLSVDDARRATDRLDDALAIARQIGDQKAEALALCCLGNLAYDLGETPRSIQHYEQALAIARETGERRIEGISLGNLGVCYRRLSDIPRAIDYFERALAIRCELGDRQGEAFDSWYLGRLYEQQGDLGSAAELIRVWIDFAHDAGNPFAESDAAHLSQIVARIL